MDWQYGGRMAINECDSVRSASLNASVKEQERTREGARKDRTFRRTLDFRLNRLFSGNLHSAGRSNALLQVGPQGLVSWRPEDGLWPGARRRLQNEAFKQELCESS